MKRGLFIVLFFGFMVNLSGCSSNDTFKDKNSTTDDSTTTIYTKQTESIVPDKVLSKMDISTEYDIKGDALNTYSHKGDIGTSYVNIQEFVEFLEGGIVNLDVDKTDTLKFSYTVDVDKDYLESGQYTYEMIFDANTNKISFNDFDLLSNLNVDSETEYLTDITLVGLDVPNQNYAHEIDLDPYQLEIVLYENNYYIPLYLANLFFTGSYMNVYEKDDTIYLMDNSSDFSEVKYFDNDVEYDLGIVRRQTVKYLALYFDNFYGLKDYQEVDSYLNVLPTFHIDEKTTFDDFYFSIDNFLFSRDDLHTSIVTAGYRDTNYSTSSLLYEGKIKTVLNAYSNNACYNHDEEISTIVDENTMVITINSFTLQTKDLIAPIMEQAKNYDNIIFDLSCNLGGSVVAVLEVLVYLTDQPISLSYMNPITNTETTENYQSSTNKFMDKNYYLRTSEVTFSAANLFASIFKDMNLGPMIGTKSSGGAAAITYTVLPDGAIIVNSSNMLFMNENKEIIEDGIDVDMYTDYNSGWWEDISKFKNILEDEHTLNFNYETSPDSIDFNLSIEADLENFEDEVFILTFRDYHTGEIVKEYEFTDLTLSDSFEKPEHLDDYVVNLSAQYKYYTIYSKESINLGTIDKDLGILGDYDYTQINVGESFTINSLNLDDTDVVILNLEQSGLYSLESISNTVYVRIYNDSFKLLGRFEELQLTAGTYYVIISHNVGDNDYVVRSIVDDNTGTTQIDLVNGDNQNQAYLDFYADNETFVFTLDQDKIITLSFLNNVLDYRILDVYGNKFDSTKYDYDSDKVYTYLFPIGTYKIKVYNGRGLVNFNAFVEDVSSDIFTNDFSKVNEFGELLIGSNDFIIDYNGDQDIYYVDITEKGNYMFDSELTYYYEIDELGNFKSTPIRKVFALEPGRYYFAFSGLYMQQKSIVNVELKLILDENDENNHVTINIGEQVTNSVNNETDKDYFDFTITESGLYQINFTSDTGSVTYDLLNEEYELILRYENSSQYITLYEGPYLMVLNNNGETLKNATFTIIKK